MLVARYKLHCDLEMEVMSHFFTSQIKWELGLAATPRWVPIKYYFLSPDRWRMQRACVLLLWQVVRWEMQAGIWVGANSNLGAGAHAGFCSQTFWLAPQPGCIQLSPRRRTFIFHSLLMWLSSSLIMPLCEQGTCRKDKWRLSSR